MANQTIRLDIEVDASKGTATLKQFAGEAEAATKKAGDAAKEGGKGFSEWSSALDETVGKLKELLTPANLFGSVVGLAVVETLHRAIDATSEWAHELQRLTLVTGSSIGAVAELQDASEKLGIGAGRLQRAFFLLSSEIEGGGRNLAKLGIATHDASGRQREALEVMGLMSDKLRTLNSATEQAVIVRKSLGRQAVDLLPIFTLEREQIQELGKDAKAFAERFGTEGVKNLILFGGALAEVGQGFTRLQVTLVSDLAPGIKVLADLFSQFLNLLTEVPKPIRLVGEALVIAGVALVTVGAAVKVVGIAIAVAAQLFALLNPWVAGAALALTAIALVGPTVASWLTSMLPQAVIDAWQRFSSFVTTSWQGLKELVGITPTVPQPEEPKTGDTRKTAQDLQIEYGFLKKLTDQQLALYQATHTAYDFQRQASIQRQKDALKELEIEYAKTEIPAEVAILDQTKTAIKARGAAERAKIDKQEQLELLSIEQQTAEQYLAQEAVRRQASLAARTDEIAQAKLLVKQEYEDFGISHQAFVDETIRLNNLELEAKKAALNGDVQQALSTQKLKESLLKQQVAALTITQAKADEERVKLQADTDVKLAELDSKRAEAERAAINQNTALRREVTAEEQAFVAQAEDKDLARKIANLEAWKAAHADNVKVVMAADAQLFQAREEGYNRDLKTAIDAELKKTQLYHDEGAKQVAIQAGVIDKLKQIRDKFYQDTATFLEQQARQAGDLGAAYQVGFAQAASSADDAFSAMRKAGTDTYQVLKSGASDFLYDTMTRAKSFGDAFTGLFVDMGKRIVRTMTDAFAEIIVKQALMTAGFSLPGLLGTAGTAAAGMEGGPNQAAQAVQELGSSATGAASALGGVAHGGSIVTMAFSAITQTIGMFASGIVAVLQFIGSIASGNAASGAASLFGSGGGSLLGQLSSGLSSIFSALSGGFDKMMTGVFDLLTNGGQNVLGFGGSGAAGALGEGMSFIADAAPWIGAAYGLYQMFSGQLSPMSGAIQGAAIGTMIAPGIGTAIGAVVGTIAGFLSGLFGGPTPEISGKTVLQPTTVAGVMSATPAVHWGENGPTVVNPPGRSQFSYLQSGPFYEEMYYHRSEGQLSREQSQISIMNVILGTMQAAVKSVAALIPQMPTADLSKALSDRLHATLAAGFEITNFDVEGDNAVAKFGDYLKALSAHTLDVFGKQLFTTIDLKALGGDDVIKGWDNLMSAMGAMGAILKTLKLDTEDSSVTLDQFAERSVAYFKQFAKEGEAFTDTVKRITTALSGILDLQGQVAQRQQALTGDVVSAITAQGRALMTMIDNIGSLADALHVAVEAHASPEDVQKAAQALLQAYDAAIQMAQQLQAQIAALKGAIISGVDLVIDLTQKIDSLRGQTLSASDMQFGLDSIVYLFNALGDVSSRISLFAAGLRGLSENMTLFTANIPLAVQGFNVIMDQIQHMSNPQQALGALKDLAGAVESGLQAAIAGVQRETQLRIEALNAEKSGIQAAFAARRTALQAERDQITKNADTQKAALQTQLQLVQQWASVASSVKSQLTDLFNLLAPTHPLTSLNEVRAQFESAFASFQTGPTPEGATHVQELAKQLLDLAKQTPGYELPGSAFQGLAGEVQHALEAIQAVTASQPSQEQIQAKIAALDQQQADSLAAIDKQLSTLDADQTAQLAAIDQQIAAAQAAGQAQIQQFQALAASGLEAIRNQVIVETTRLADEQAKAAAKLQEVLGDKTFEQFIAEKQAEAADLLRGIDRTLVHYLGGIADGLGFKVPAMADGGIVLPRPGGTLVRLGEAGYPEMVTPLSSNGGSAQRGDTTVNISFTYAGSARKDEWDRFLATVIDDARFGKLGKVISEKVKGS